MNPTEQFRESVESALDQLYTWRDGFPHLTQDEALASIQASTLEYFTRLVGEDEPVAPYVHNVFKGIDNGVQRLQQETRNALRQELRQKIDQLIKDLSNE